MKLRHRLAALVAAGLLTLTPITIAPHTGSAADSVATDGAIIVET